MESEYQAYKEWYGKENSFFRNFTKTISPIQIITLLALLIIGGYLLSNTGVNKNVVIIVMGAAIVIIVIFGNKRSQEKEPIPEHIIKTIIKFRLEQKIGVEEGIPEGTKVKICLLCKMRWQQKFGEEFLPWVWNVGFKLFFPNGSDKEYCAIANPWKGYLTGIEPRPAGYDAREATDIKIVPKEIVMRDIPQSNPQK